MTRNFQLIASFSSQLLDMQVLAVAAVLLTISLVSEATGTYSCGEYAWKPLCIPCYKTCREYLDKSYPESCLDTECQTNDGSICYCIEGYVLGIKGFCQPADTCLEEEKDSAGDGRLAKVIQSTTKSRPRRKQSTLRVRSIRKTTFNYDADYE